MNGQQEDTFKTSNMLIKLSIRLPFHVGFDANYGVGRVHPVRCIITIFPAIICTFHPYD